MKDTVNRASATIGENTTLLTIGVTGTCERKGLRLQSYFLIICGTYNRCGHSVAQGFRIRRAVTVIVRLRAGCNLTDTYSSGDSDTPSLLLGSLVDLRVVHELSATLLSEVFCDCCSERGLSVIDVLWGRRYVSVDHLIRWQHSLHQWYRCCEIARSATL